MLKHEQVIAIVGIAGLVLVGQLALKVGLRPEAEWLEYAEPVVAAILVALWLFDRWAWRWPIVGSLGGSVPDLRGTWKATLYSKWIDPATQAPIAPIVAYMAVRQTYSTVSLRLMTPESTSELLSVELLRSTDENFRIAAIYRNEPRVEVRLRSPIHYGGMLLTVQGEPPSRLGGHYWTDRNTIGDMVLEDRRAHICSRFEEAEKAFTPKT